MRDNRFIELVNLYVDRQITAEETAELEAEMQANPRRREIYRQYCKLHTATKQVYAGFRANAGEPQAGVPSGRVIRADFARRSRAHWVHYAGGLAAAACLTVLFVRYNANSQPGETQMAEIAPTAPAVQVAAATPAPAPVTAEIAPAPADAARFESALAQDTNYSVLLATLRQEDQRAFATGESPSSRLPSLFDDGVFEARPMLPVNNQRVFRGRQAPAQQAEFTAFQFQR